MAYIAPIHRPNSVRHALRAHLFPGDEDCMILGKTNRLEFWKVDQESGGLTMFDVKVLNGTVSMLQRMRPKDSDTELLFVGTERFEYFTLMWDPEMQSLKTINSFFDLDEKYMRDSQSQDKCIVDPTGRYICILVWEGVLNIWRLQTPKSKRQHVHWADQIRLSELYIKSATFLHVETGQPKVAFLYQTRTDIPDSQVVIYRLFTDDKNTQPSRFDVRDKVAQFSVPDGNASILIPVGRGDRDQKRYLVRNAAHARAQLGGLLVVGETRLLYYDEAAKKTVEAALKEASIFVAWAEYDVSHYFIADDYGNMWMLEILLEEADVTGLEMRKIGVTSRANTLTYLEKDILFVGSHYGDSQVWNINEDYSLQLLQELPNISPILDFNIMDMGNREGDGKNTNEYSSGQARIVAGCGVWKDGSLRSVRSGVGLDDVGILADMEKVRSVFPVKSRAASKHDTLVVSFLTDTRVFTFDPAGEIEEVEAYKGLVLHEQTMLVQNLPNERLLQVTPSIVQLIDLEGGMAISSWNPGDGQEITNASANDDWILISVNGKSLVSLRLQQDSVQTKQNDLGEKDQVACMHLPPQYPEVGVVGFWKSGTVSIVDLSTLQSIHSESLRRKDDKTSVPRDIVLAQILPPETSGPTLFVAMEDGFVITFNVSKDYALSGRKSIVLGTRHARLQLLPRPNGVYNVFSTSEHPSLIYGSHGRIIYSAVTAEEATCVCPFDTEAFPGSMVVATEKMVKISLIDDQRRTHVQTLPQGHNVRRLAYSRNERVFALGCIKRTIANKSETVNSTIKIVDEVIFDQVGKDFPIDGHGRLEMIESVIRAELPDSYGQLVERFMVGTSFLDSDVKDDEARGRILVLGIDSERNPYLVGQHNLKGSCRCLGVLGDKIVAALTKTVVIYRYVEVSSTSAKLERLASYRPSTYPVDLAIEGNMIAVADMMKSLSLIQFTPAADGQPAKLKEIARHQHAVWATAVSYVDGSSWLEADANGNLLVLSQNEAGVTEEDKRRMEITSEMNLGEMVNRIQKVTVESSKNAIVVPRAFLGTVEGAIYMFGTIAPNQQDLLIRFQTNLARELEPTGELVFDKYRSFRNEEREGEGPFRFVDGELIERFLDMDEAAQEKICEGLGPDVESMRNLVEELKRLH